MRRTSSSLGIGASELTWTGDGLRIRFDEKQAIGGKRLVGELRLLPGALFDEVVGLDLHGRHCWWPVAPHSRAEVILDLPRGFRFQGHAYHDANFGAEPLEDAFASWGWSRARGDDRTVVLYDRQRREGGPAELTRVYTADGRVDTLELPQAFELGRSRWGIPRSTRCDPGGRAQIVRTLEDTPFYARTELRTEVGGRSLAAVHEALDLERFRRRFIQHLLTYRIRRSRRSRG